MQDFGSGDTSSNLVGGIVFPYRISFYTIVKKNSE
jgi:hypothetical protein